MRKITLFVAALVLSMSAQAEEVNPHAGTYSECVKWTIFNGVPTSKKFETVYGEDRSLLYRIEFYNGTDKCEGEAVDRKEFSEFEVIKSFGRSLRFIEVKEVHENLYLQLMISDGDMSVTISDKYPIKIQMNNFIILKLMK